MKKRLIAFFCALALLAGLFPAGTYTAATVKAAEQKYMVGYAIRDINPEAEHLGEFYLTGNDNDSDRPGTGIMDDNGKPGLDDGDGLFTTCISITDAANKTVMLISVDLLKGYSSVAGDTVRQQIADAVVKAGGSITADQIVISGSHTHSGPNTDNLKNDAPGYYNKIVAQLEAVATAAYQNRRPATMKRGSVDAKAATREIYGTEYKMNFLRHYKVTAKAESTFLSNGETSTKTYIAGSNFGKMPAVGGVVSDFGTYQYSNWYSKGDYKVTDIEHIAEADHTMGLLTFDVEGDRDIVLINWGAHPTTNSEAGDKLLVSSDYIGALRYALEQNNYRAAFVQAGGANSVISSKVETDWTERNNGVASTVVYGQMLADIALYGLDEANGCMKDAPAGEIKTAKFAFQGEIQPYDSNHNTVARNVLDDLSTQYPYRDPSTGIIINSRLHASQIVQRYRELTGTDKDGNVVATPRTHRQQDINVISLGQSALFLTAPNELSDRYGSVNNSNYNIDWADLANANTYGAPFIMSNTNGNEGYLPNYLNYTYNSKEYDTITSTNNNGSEILAPGSYEANTSYFAKGTGEQMLKTYQVMIDLVEGEYDKQAECKACKQDAQWQPIFQENVNSVKWETGHYYFAEDIVWESSATMVPINPGVTVCVDLNGKNISCKQRFATDVGGQAEGATLSVFDMAGDAVVTSGVTSSNRIGGVIFIRQGYTVNIYGGTYCLGANDNDTYKVVRGGIAFAHGTLNMYGGTLVGATVHYDENADNPDVTGRGGAVNVSGSGVLNVYGGHIESGDVTAGGAGPCVFMQDSGSRLTLSGAAQVDDIYYSNTPKNNLTVSGIYTGKANLSFPSTVSEGMDIGNSVNADLTKATITVTDEPNALVTAVYTDNTADTDNLYLALPGQDYEAVICTATGVTSCATVANANPPAGAYIKLLKDVKNISLQNTAYMDLNGHNIDGITVADSATLYCMDSCTDDYIVEKDGDTWTGFGKLKNVTSEVEGVPVEYALADDGYLKVSGDDGISFHRVCLDLTHINLRAEKAGIYYKSAFASDEIAAQKIIKFGVAMSIIDIPTEENLEEECEYSKFNGSLFREGSGTSTIVINIMKEENGEYINFRNANTKIYGRAYILTDDGYMFGMAKNRTLKETIVAIDEIWNTLAQNKKEPVLRMYQKFENVMKTWNLENISADE